MQSNLDTIKYIENRSENKSILNHMHGLMHMDKMSVWRANEASKLVGSAPIRTLPLSLVLFTCCKELTPGLAPLLLKARVVVRECQPVQVNDTGQFIVSWQVGHC